MSLSYFWFGFFFYWKNMINDGLENKSRRDYSQFVTFATFVTFGSGATDQF